MPDTLDAPVRWISPVVDYDVHGLVAIRLFDPSARDLSAISAQIGDLQGPLPHEPDLTIRFVAELRPKGELCWVEPHEVGFSDEGFFLFTAGSGRKPTARLALDDVDGSLELVCRSGIGAVPLLRSLIDLSMLTKGVVPLHASAFAYNGNGVLIGGWARAGKTTSLLAFAADGAAFIGDDRVYLHSKDNRLYGLDGQIALSAWHLAELPRYRHLVSRRARSRLRLTAEVGNLSASVCARSGGRLGRFADRVANLSDDSSVAIPPHKLFMRCPFTGTLDRAFLGVVHESAEVRVEPVEPRYIADRLTFAGRAERLQLLALYLSFRFAFPDRATPLIDQADEIERELLVAALTDTEAYALYHPFPAPVRALREAMAPLLT